MEISHDESAKASSNEDSMRKMEETIAYMQNDIDALKKLVGELQNNSKNTMTETSKLKRRVDTWPFVTVPV
jgi:regulator of replication initiation timing